MESIHTIRNTEKKSLFLQIANFRVKTDFLQKEKIVKFLQLRFGCTSLPSSGPAGCCLTRRRGEVIPCDDRVCRNKPREMSPVLVDAQNWISVHGIHHRIALSNALGKTWTALGTRGRDACTFNFKKNNCLFLLYLVNTQYFVNLFRLNYHAFRTLDNLDIWFYIKDHFLLHNLIMIITTSRNFG